MVCVNNTLDVPIIKYVWFSMNLKSLIKILIIEGVRT